MEEMEKKPRRNTKADININFIKDNNINILTRLFVDFKNNDQDDEESKFRRKNSVQISEIFLKNSLFDLAIQKSDDFSSIILARLDEIEKKSESRFKVLINQYKECYNEYKKRIIDYLKTKEKNITKAIEKQQNNENLLKYAYHNIFNKINNLTEIHDDIINNIEDNYNLLNKFLKEDDLINKQNPIEDFLIKNSTMIYHSSVLTKFNLEEINTSEITRINYYKRYLEYLHSEKKTESITSYTLSNDNIEEGLKVLESTSGIKTVNVIDVKKGNLMNILDTIHKNNDYLDSIKIKKFEFDFNMPKNDGIIKSKEVKIKNGINLSLKKILDIFISHNTSLTNLYIEKIDMTNIGFETLMRNLYDSPCILNNLEYLSLSGNEITSINREEDNKNLAKIFKKLKIFDLSKNNIYNFELLLNKFPELKLLDLSDNSISTPFLMNLYIKEEKKKLVLFNNNIFITNSTRSNNKYIEYLHKRLQKLDFELKNLNLCFSYNINNQKCLENMKFSPAITISLIKLDLSYCGLSTEVLTKFLENNFGLFSLQKLLLEHNYIKSEIFDKLLSDEIILENLNCLDLSYNDIGCEKYEENESLIKFIKKYTNLKSIKLIITTFFNFWNLNLDNKEKDFKQLYIDLLNDLKVKNRAFKIVIEDNEKDSYIEKCLSGLFVFKNH